MSYRRGPTPADPDADADDADDAGTGPPLAVDDDNYVPSDDETPDPTTDPDVLARLRRHAEHLRAPAAAPAADAPPLVDPPPAGSAFSVQ